MIYVQGYRSAKAIRHVNKIENIREGGHETHFFIVTALNIYILLDVLVCSIAVYFYELCGILTSPYKQRVKIYSDTTHQNV